MKIAASIYACKKNDLTYYVRTLDQLGLDMFHLDFDDSKMLLSELEDDVKLIQSISAKKIDLHVISPSPEKYFDFIVKNKIAYACFQHECVTDKVILPKKGTVKFGLSIMGNTPIRVYSDYDTEFDYISFMTSAVAGKSGGAFEMNNISRIHDFHKMHPECPVHVDGGLRKPLINKMKELKVSKVVLGSMLSTSVDLKSTVRGLYID